MTQIKAFAMTSDQDTFVQVATAFRNARDLAKNHRDRLIEMANAIAGQSNVEARPEPEAIVAVAKQYEELTDVGDCEDYPGSQVVSAENHAVPGDIDEEPVLPQYLYTEDEEASEEFTSLGAEPAMSFATSFTSSFGQGQSQTRSKRTRASSSPLSTFQPYKKHSWAKRTYRSAS
ncbi:hypothetical protein P885DRAFT_64085 [Corynascus similis CBS 632.67]